MFELQDGKDEVIPKGGGYGRPDINLLFSFWEQTMGFPITVKKVENRRFLATLLKRESAERIQQYIVLAWTARLDRYAPRITSFVDLYYKWDKLTDWAMRSQTQRGDVINLD